MTFYTNSMETGEKNAMYDQSPTYLIGLDITCASYITNYIIGVLAMIYGTKMLLCLRGSRKMVADERHEDAQGDSNTTRQKAHYHLQDLQSVLKTLCGGFYACSLMHITGGLVHTIVPSCVPATILCNETEEFCQNEYQTVLSSVIPLLALWQIAKIFSNAFALLMIASAVRTIVCESRASPKTASPSDERPFKFTKKNCVYSHIRILSKIIQCVLLILWIAFTVYHISICVSIASENNRGEFTENNATDVVNGTSKNIEDIWAIQGAMFVLGFSLVVYITASIYLAVSHSRAQKRLSVRGIAESNSNHILLEKSNDPDSSSNSTQETDTSNSSGEQRQIPPKISPRILRCIGLFIMFCGGMTQWILSYSCGKANAFECPLPYSFNHNAVYHLLFSLGMSLWFLAEYCYFRSEICSIKRSMPSC